VLKGLQSFAWEIILSLLETTKISCPYCGEMIDIVVDCSVYSQEYIEDCHVCCRPIVLTITIDNEGVPLILARNEDE